MPPLVWLLIGLLAAVLVVVGLGVVRLRALVHRVGSFECGLRPASNPQGAWTQGIAHYGVGRIDWWRFWSVSLRPAQTWSREDLTITGRVPLDAAGRPDVYLVRCSVQGRDLELTMSSGAYAGLASWLEAAPPGRRDVVV